MSEDTPLFDLPDELIVEQEPTPGQIASKIFKNWYKPYYKGKYSQSAGHIMKVLTDAVKNGVDLRELEEAMMLLGRTRQPVTALSLQHHLKAAQKRLDSNVSMTDMGIEEYVDDFDATDPSNYR